jgi:hypothetical protein
MVRSSPPGGTSTSELSNIVLAPGSNTIAGGSMEKPRPADACVWALTALMKRGGAPRITAL